MTMVLLGVAWLLSSQAPSPPGRLVDIGGRRLHVHCTGHGRPTVLIETGFGDFSFDWILVQERLAPIARTCTYDRAGYAWSDPGPEPRTFAQLNAEIRSALARIGERGPFVLIGHSYGGGVVRAWAVEHPRDVVGLVLVDAVGEQQYISMGPHAGRIGDSAKGRPIPPPTTAAVRRPASTAASAATPAAIEPPYDRLPSTVQALHAWAAAQPSVEAAENSQREWSAEYYARWVAAPQQGSLGRLPLVVLTRARGGYGDNLDKPAAELEATRLAAQQALARLSSRGMQRLVDSGHNMHLEAPEVIVSAVREILRQLR